MFSLLKWLFRPHESGEKEAPAIKLKNEAPREYGPEYLSPRDWCDRALQLYCADSSPNPFNTRHGEFGGGDDDYTHLCFQVEEELLARIGDAPPHFCEAALSLVQEKPYEDWLEWDYALDLMLQGFAVSHRSHFQEHALTLLDDPKTRRAIIEVACSVGGYKDGFEEEAKASYRAWLARFIENPDELRADEIWALEDLVDEKGKTAFKARLGETQKLALEELKREFGVD